ncbi:MAG: SAM-dependent methyltransferase, partial [Nocardioidaceae bacterium]|nr:SAM-dependent methyltransferase [Nocardioidaceae bacterium]
MDLETFDWLLTDDGQALLVQAAALVGDGRSPLAVGSALRRTTTGERAAAALTQVELRERAVAKFGDRAHRMYFTPDGLEQSTRLPVAQHRAGRYTAFEARSLIDLGCGIGGDLVAAAQAGVVCAGVDLDPIRVAIAEANLAALGLAGAVRVADATEVDHTAFDLAFADPARRTGAGRSFRVEDWNPPWPWVQSLLERDACVKVAPGIPHRLIPSGVEAEWVSDTGEVKEAALWAGRTATTARRATVIPASGGLASLTD